MPVREAWHGASHLIVVCLVDVSVLLLQALSHTHTLCDRSSLAAPLSCAFPDGVVLAFLKASFSLLPLRQSQAASFCFGGHSRKSTRSACLLNASDVSTPQSCYLLILSIPLTTAFLLSKKECKKKECMKGEGETVKEQEEEERCRTRKSGVARR